MFKGSFCVLCKWMSDLLFFIWVFMFIRQQNNIGIVLFMISVKIVGKKSFCISFMLYVEHACESSVKHSVPIKIIWFPTSRRIEWRNSMPHFSSLSERRNDNIEYLISFELESNLQPLYLQAPLYSRPTAASIKFSYNIKNNIHFNIQPESPSDVIGTCYLHEFILL